MDWIINGITDRDIVVGIILGMIGIELAVIVNYCRKLMSISKQTNKGE